MNDLVLCRVMHWTLDDVYALSEDEHDVLTEELVKESERLEKASRSHTVTSHPARRRR